MDIISKYSWYEINRICFVSYTYRIFDVHMCLLEVNFQKLLSTEDRKDCVSLFLFCTLIYRCSTTCTSGYYLLKIYFFNGALHLGAIWRYEWDCCCWFFAFVSFVLLFKCSTSFGCYLLKIWMILLLSLLLLLLYFFLQFTDAILHLVTIHWRY